MTSTNGNVALGEILRKVVNLRSKSIGSRLRVRQASLILKDPTLLEEFLKDGSSEVLSLKLLSAADALQTSNGEVQ
jgi:hypothetical protein